MNSKHLSKGDACPPLGNTMRIYNMRFCPYAQRPVLVALAKNIPYEIVNCSLAAKPEWLFEKNPAGKVPALELEDGRVLVESLIIADYLDEAFPNRPLWPKDPFRKALDRILIEEFNKVAAQYYKVLTEAKDADASSWKEHIDGLQQSLAPFEKELKNRGTLYFSGDEAPGMLDYMIWPWFERLPTLKLKAPAEIVDFEAAKAQHPALETWRQAMKEDGAVKQYLISPEIQGKFVESFMNGKPNYDLLLQ